MDAPRPDIETDPTAVVRDRRLELIARELVEGRLLGNHRSPYKGSSVEFVEHRRYSTGDELRHIDWRAYAKTREYFVKLFEEETNLRAFLVLDASGSMAYAGATLSKFAYARVLAAAVGYLLLRQRDACGLITVGGGEDLRREPTATQRTFAALIRDLEDLRPSGIGGLAQRLRLVAPTLPRRSVLLLFSDGFEPLDPLIEQLRALRAAGHELLWWQIVAPEEVDFPFREPTTFRGLEPPASQQAVDPQRFRQQYQQRFRTFCERLDRDCAALRVDRLQVTTTTPFETAIVSLLGNRQGR